MEESTPIKSVAYPYGIVLAIFSILVLVLMYVLNLEQGNWMMAVLNVLVTIAIFIYAIKEYKKKNSGFLSIKEALKVGLAVAVVAGLIAGIYTYIHYTYIYPEFSGMIYDQAVIQMSEQQISEAQQEQALGITAFTTSPFFFATMTLVSSLFYGFLISLIAGAIMKQKRPEHV